MTRNASVKQDHRGLVKFLVCSAALVMLIAPVRASDAIKEIPNQAGNEPVMIVASPKSGIGPLTVRLKPVINETLKGPVEYQWWFGDGEQSHEAIPQPHYYDLGSYNVVLKVKDSTGKVCTASITIDSVRAGCGASCEL